VELLFLSAVVGYIYYIASVNVIFPLLELINTLINHLPAVISSTISFLNLQINYTQIAQFFVFLFITLLVFTLSYFIIILSVGVVVKIIQYCLDPNDDIFPNYKRFNVLKRINFSETLLFSIPFLLGLISYFCFFLGGLINSIQNIVFSYDVWTIINTLIQAFILCFVVISLYFMGILIKGNIEKIFRFIVDTKKEILNPIFHSNRKSKTNKQKNLKDSKILIFILNHLTGIMLLCVFCLFLFSLTQYHQGIYSRAEFIVWLVVIMIFLAIIYYLDKKDKRNQKNDIPNLNHPILISPPTINHAEVTTNNLIDAPLEDPKDDLFCRNNFEHGIINLIKERRDPSSTVIGIYGEWGEGKTSLLNFISSDLKDEQGIVCIKYNPWRYSDESQLLRNFFFTLSDALERSISTRKERIGEYFSKYASILSPLSIGLGGIVDLSPGEVFSNVGKAFSSVELESLKERIEKILDDENKKVVIFIDDIDRLDRQEIQMLLKIVKLCANFRHTIYILAFDEEMVASAISEKYGSGSDDPKNTENGKRFLEKIIQIPLPLPKINNNILLELSFQGIDALLKNEAIQLSEEEIRQFGYQFNLGFRTQLKTPRSVKRYLNSLTFTLSLLKNAINVSDLLLIEGIKIFRPSYFQKIREYPEIFLGTGLNLSPDSVNIKKRYQAIWDSSFNDETGVEKETLKRVISHLFPRTRIFYENVHYGPEWDRVWDKEKKIASKRHLDRYFAFAFPKGDISEIEVKQFIATYGELNDAQKFETLKKFTADVSSADLFMWELRKNIGDLDQGQLSEFILTLSKNSHLFPKTDIGFKLSPYSQLAAFLHEQIDAIPETSQKMSLLKLICSSAEPLSFGFNILRNVEQKIKAEPNPNMSGLQEVDLNALSNIILERVQKISLDSLISSNDMPITFYYWLKYGSKKDIESYLSESFASKPDSVIRFLKCYVSKAFNADGPVRGSLMRDSYNAIAKFCDPSIIYTALERLFGDLSNAEYREDDDIIDEERQIANQFSYMYHHKEQKTAELIPTESDQTSNEKAEKDN
jgi:Cdc6-like AAA superfamily ATPase